MRRFLQPPPRSFAGLVWCQSLNRIRSARAGDVLRFTVLFLLGVAFVVVDYLFFHRLWKAVLLSPLPTIESIELILSTVLSFFFVFLFYSNLLSAVSTLYASTELPFLLSFPIPLRRIYLRGFADTVARSSAMFLLFGIPALAALGVAYGVSCLVWLRLLPPLIAYLLIPGALGIAVCHILMRFLPRRRVHQALVVVGLCVGAALIAGLRSLRIEYLWGSSAQQLDAVKSLVGVSELTPQLIPARWTADAVLSLLATEGAASRYSEIFLLTLAGASVGGCYLLTRITYLSAWSRSLSVGDPTVKGKILRFPGFHRSTNALIQKDILCVRRQLHRWSQLLMMVPLLGLYILNLVLLPLEGTDWAGIVVWVNLGVVGFLVAAVSARFLVPAVSADGMAYWIVRSAPVRTRQVVLTKFFLFCCPVLFLALGCSVLLQFFIPAEIDQFLIGVCCTGILTLALSAMGIGIGAAFPRFDAKSDLDVSLGTAGLLYMLAALLLVGVSDWWLLLPFIKTLPRLGSFFLMESVSLPFRFALFAAVAGAAGILSLEFGIHRLQKVN